MNTVQLPNHCCELTTLSSSPGVLFQRVWHPPEGEVAPEAESYSALWRTQNEPLGILPWSLQPSPGRRGELIAKPAVAEVLLWHWGAQQVLLVLGQPRAAGTAGPCSCPTDCPGPGRTEGRTSRQLGMDGVLALQGCPGELHSPGPRKRPWGTRQQHPEPMRG